MYIRSLNLANEIADSSLFILGPRQTGKSTLVRSQFPGALHIDLLNSRVFMELKVDPVKLSEMLAFHAKKHAQKIIIIDEIQRLPELLNEVHRLIESDKDLRFILTGSSARKLRMSGVNLLGGRASKFILHPLTSIEVKSWPEKKQNWEDIIQYGSLPSILTAAKPHKKLADYVAMYLQEEIAYEKVVRSLPDFYKFLSIAAQMNTEQIVYESIARDCHISANTVRNYFKILEDTLFGSLVEPFRETKKREAVSSSRFYFFDIGVWHSLLGRNSISPSTSEFGEAVEHFIYNEIKAYISYTSLNYNIKYWRTKTGLEVDFILERPCKTPIAIEVKAKKSVANIELNGLLSFAEDFPSCKKIVVSLEEKPRITSSGIEIIPVQIFLDLLWKGDIC